MHPKTLDKFQAFLAKKSMLVLIAYFVAFVLMVSFALATGYMVTDLEDSRYSLSAWWRFDFLQLVAVDAQSVAIDYGNRLPGALYVFSAILRLAIPALFFGAVVFKLLVARNIFTYRKALSV